MSSTELIYFATCCRRLANAEADEAVKRRLLAMAQDYDKRASTNGTG